VDEISIDTTQYRANRILWNGDDTVALGDTTYINLSTAVQGRVLIFLKIEGVWTLTSVIEGSDYVTAPGYFAHAMLLVDPSTIAIGAPNTQSEKGKAFLLRRERGGTWQVTMEFIGRNTRYYFGNNVMKTNYDLVVQTGDTGAYGFGRLRCLHWLPPSLIVPVLECHP
jgi:hypothetical protein